MTHVMSPSSLSSKLRAFRSSDLGSTLIPDLYNLIGDILISQLENDRDQYQINDESMKFLTSLVYGLDPIDVYFTKLQQPVITTSIQI